MKTITPEEARTLMGDFARGGEPVIAAWLHGFDAGHRLGCEDMAEELLRVFRAKAQIVGRASSSAVDGDPQGDSIHKED